MPRVVLQVRKAERQSQILRARVQQVISENQWDEYGQAVRGEAQGHLNVRWQRRFDVAGCAHLLAAVSGMQTHRNY